MVLLAVLLLLTGREVYGQGSAQVQILGVPGVLDSPQLAEQVNRFETGQYPIQFVYTAPTNREETFRFLFTLEKDGRRIAEVESEPVTFAPGFYLYNNFRDEPRIEFRETLNQVIRSLPRAESSSFSSGLIPEGNYTLMIEPVPEDRFSMVSTLSGIIQFTVSYGQPPLLISPAEGSDVVQPFPIFTWSPVIAPADVDVEYEIRVVELLRGQQPEQAVDGARFPVFEEVVQNLSSFMMTPQQLSLEPGTTYAWQVTARDLFGEYPFRNEGRSEIGIFTYQGLSGEAESIAELQEVILIPGFARMMNLNIIQSAEDDFSYTLDGTAMLQIGNPTTVPVQFEQLRIQKTGLDNPVVLGGTVNGSVQNAELPFSQEAGIVEFMDLSWTFGEEFQLGGDIRLPGEEPVASSGTLSWTPQGLHGELTADAPEGLKVGNDPVEVELTGLSARFPEALISALGGLTLFGNSVECDIGNISIGTDGLGVVFDCDFDEEIPLNEGFDYVTLNDHRAVGMMTSTWDEETEYSLSLSSKLQLNIFTGPDCSSSIQLGMSSEDGVSVQSFNSNCITNPSINLGIGTLHVRNLETPEISYSEEDGWGYRLPMNRDLAFHFERRSSEMGQEPGEQQPGDDPDETAEREPGEQQQPDDDPDSGQTGEPGQPGDEQHDDPGEEFTDDDTDETTPPEPGQEPIRTPADDPVDEEDKDAIGDEGIEFREREYDEGQLSNSEGCISGFFVRPRQMRIPEFTIPWSDYLPAITDVDFPLEFFFDAELRLGCTTVKPRVEIPECLKDFGLELEDASYSNGALHAEITTTELPDEGCFTDFGPGFTGDENYGLKLKQIGGSISGSAGDNGFEQEGKVWVETALMAGSPFNCGENSESTELLTGDLNVRSDGIFEGELSGHIGCPLEFGGFSLSLSDATVAFTAGQLGQRAKLTGIAELEYEDRNRQTLTSTGNVAVNLVTGEIETLELLIEGPFAWGFPQENPFMEFELDQALLNRQGLQIDGTHSQIIRDESLDVVFDELLVGFDGRIKSGKISTVPSVALSGGLGSSEMTGSPISIDFGLSLPDSTVPEELMAGFLINLESPIIVDSSGIVMDGEADALLRFGSYTPPVLTASMDQFRLAFNSPVVAQGEVSLSLGASTVATINSEGFHPAWDWIEELIPDRLELPAEEIAWLDLKNDDGEFVVDYEIDENGLIQLSTKENMELLFGAPILTGVYDADPGWSVTLDNVAIEQGSFLLMQGGIVAELPDGMDPIDLSPMGIPLAMEAFRFERSVVGDSPVTRLYAAGNITLFGNDLGENATAEIWFDATGRAHGSIVLEGLNAEIPLQPESDMLYMLISELSMDVDVAPNTTGMDGIDLSFSGGLELRFDNMAALELSLDAEYNNAGNLILDVDYQQAVVDQEVRLGFDFGYLMVDEIHSLFLEYDPLGGFDFEAGLDLRLGFSNPDIDLEFDLPIRDIFFTREGIRVPNLDLDQINIQPLQVMDVSIKPLAFRIAEPVTIEWEQNWQNSLFNLIDPEIDFEIRMPELTQNMGQGYQALSQAGFSFYNVRWQNGILEGAMEAYTFGANEQGLEVAIGQTGSTLLLKSASGALEAVNGTQGINISMDADVTGLPGFDTDSDGCRPGVTMEVASGRYLIGEVTGFAPCGTMGIGPLGLEFTGSSLLFGTSDSGQELVLSGEPTLLLPPLQEGGDPVQVTGESLSIDLINMAILSGEVVVDLGASDGFRWALPRFENPFIDMRVTKAQLDSEGFTISGNAELNLFDQISSPQILLNDMRFGFEEFAIESGSLTLLSEAALEVGLFGEGFWRLVPPPDAATDIPDVPHFSMTLPEQVTLDANGLTVSGVSSGRLNMGQYAGEGEDSLFPDLDLHLVNDSDGNPFRVEINPPGYTMPARLAGGQIDFILNDDRRLAYYSATEGFRVDDLLAAFELPEKIGLPNSDIAYLVLKDDEGNEFVTTEAADGGGWAVSGTGVDLVLAALGDENREAPVFAIDFSLTVDDSYTNITGGEIEINFEDGFDLEPFTHLPMDLTGIRFKQGSDYQLGGSATIRLPEAVTEELGLEEIVIDELLFTENGFQQATLSTGNYQESYDSDEDFIEYEISPVDKFGFYGAEIQFGETNSAQFSGFFDMEVMADDDQRNPVFFKTEWSAGEGKWDVLIGIEKDTNINLGLASLNVTELGGAITYQTNDNDGDSFSVFISGELAFEEMLGNDFKLSVEELTFGIGTDKPVSVKSVKLQGDGQACKNAEEDPHILLFDGALKGCLDSASADITEENAIRVSISGDLILFDRPMRFDTLTVGTDLYFAIDADLLPGDETLELFEDLAYVNSLTIGWESAEKNLKLEGGMVLNLPEPASGNIESDLLLVQNNGVVDEAILDVSYFFDDESDINEIDVGDLFRFRMDGIGAKIDFLNFGQAEADQSMFFGYANLLLEKESDGSFNPDKRVRFGDPVNEEYGISYSLSDGLKFNAKGENISADIGFFNISFETIETIEIEGSPFALGMSGSLSLLLEGVEGTVAYSDFQIKVPPVGELNPVHQWPAFEGASVTIMDLLSLSLGTYDYQMDGTIELAHGDDPEEIEYETVPVSRYLRFYNAIEGESALELTVDGLFSGGVEEVLFYQRSDNNAMRMLIQNANLSVDAGEDLVALSLTLNYETDGAGGFGLLAAGSGQFAGNGFAAVGNFSTMGGVTRMGLFIAATFTPAVPLIPQAPPVIGISGFGGGFFWKPEQGSVNEVFTQLDNLGMSFEGVQGAPAVDENTLFAAFLYSRFDMLGQAGFYAMQGNMLLSVTNQLMQINASGALLMQDSYIEANLSTQLAWSPTTIELNGGVYAALKYPFVEGFGTISYRVLANIPAQTINWALDGSYDADVMGFNSFGQFSVAPTGFFADMTVQADVDLQVIALTGNMFAKVWMIPNLSEPLNSELGGLAELTIEVSKWGYAFAGMEASLAYTQEGFNRYNMMGYGALYVDLYVFTGDLYGVIEIDCDGCVIPSTKAKVTTEIDGALVDLVNDAQSQAESAQSGINDALDGIQDQIPVYDPSISEEDLIAAGTALQYFGPGQALSLVTAFGYRQDQAVYAKANIGDIPFTLNVVKENIVGDPGEPSFGVVEQAQDDAETKLSSVQTVSGRVMSRLDAAVMMAIEAVEESELALVELVNPVSDGPGQIDETIDGFSVSGEIPFSVNTGLLESAMNAAMNNREQLDDQQDIEEQNRLYRDAIYAATLNLMEIDEIIEEELLELGEMYGSAVSGMQKMYAEHMNYFWRSKQRFEHLKTDLNQREDDVYFEIGQIIDRAKSYSHNMCEDLIQAEMEVPSLSTNRLNQLENSHMCLGVLVDLIAQKRALIDHLAEYMAEGSWQGNLSSRQAAHRNELYNSHVQSVINSTGTFIGPLSNEVNSSDELNGFTDNVESVMRNFWFNQHNLALESLVEEQLQNIASLNSTAKERLADLDEAYADYSQRLENLFLLKTQMTETLYVLLDSHGLFVQQHELDMDQTIEPRQERWQLFSQQANRYSGAAPQWSYGELRQKIEQWLQPPVISGFSGNSVRPSEFITGGNENYQKFMSRNELDWTLVPGDPEHLGLTELGITTSGNAQNALRALGKESSYTFYGWKESEGYHNRIYNVALRVRGRGGIAVSQTGDIHTAHSSASDSYGSWSYTGPVTSNVGAQQQPPDMLDLSILNAESVGGVNYSVESDRLTIRARGFTFNSEIARFEHAISSTNSQENLNYSPLSGVRSTEQTEVSVTGTVEDLNLEPGTYWVFVRAVGSGGLQSPPSIRQLVIDPQTPQFTGSTPSNDPDHSVNSTEHTAQGSVVAGLPAAGNPAFIPVTPVDKSDYARTVQWRSAETGPSGLKRYEVVLSQSETVSAAMFGSENAIHTTNTQRMMELPFGRNYLYVRALSRAGLYSDVETYVIENPDPTPPSTPVVKVQPRNNGFRIYLPQQSQDPETGILGYQYRVVDQLSGNVIKEWPNINRIENEEDFVDFTAGQLTSPPGDGAPYYPVYYHQLGIESDGSVHPRVELKAINGDMLPSAIVRVESFSVTKTTPELVNWDIQVEEAEVVEFTEGPLGINMPVTNDGLAVRAKVTAADEPGSGVQSLQLVIRDGITNEKLFDKIHKPGGLTGQLPAKMNHNFYYGASSLLSRGSVDVTLRIENGLGVSKSWNESVLINEEVVNNTPAPRLSPRLHYREDMSISQIDFYWDDGQHPYVDRYRLYRGSGETGTDQFTHVSTSLPIREQPYILVNPAESEHFFLTAQNQFGVETSLSEVDIWVAEPAAAITGMVTDFTYSDIAMTGSTTADVSLRWEGSGSVHGYALFRVGADGRHNLIRVLPEDVTFIEFEVTSLSSSYVVKAVTENGNYGPPGNILEINLELYSEAKP